MVSGLISKCRQRYAELGGPPVTIYHRVRVEVEIDGIVPELRLLVELSVCEDALCVHTEQESALSRIRGVDQEFDEILVIEDLISFYET